MLLLVSLVSAAVASPDLEALLADELARATTTWESVDDAPYYVAVALEERRDVRVAAREGAVLFSEDRTRRFLDTDLRVGSPDFDSTHALRGFSALDDDSRDRKQVAIAGAGEETALRHAVWAQLDDRFRDARERIVLLRGEQRVRVEEEHPAPDFELRDPVSDRLPVPPLVIDRQAWEPRVVALSEVLDSSDIVSSSQAALQVRRQGWTFVDTEGSRLDHGRLHARLGLQAMGVADDGDRVTVFDAIDVHDPSSLPDQGELLARAEALVDELEALVAAPRVGPYQGPVLLSGKASAVFFHEVMGHRVEGHRQKADDEGKTFLEFVGRPVMPPWVDAYDDPTLKSLHGVDLNGFYAYDDEGVAARRAPLVEDGVFEGFLMSRSPLQAFVESNGHGRRSAGKRPVSRMGNTIVEAAKTAPMAELRRRLLAEAKSQGLEYAYIVEEIEGGFTLTGRVIPNAFNVRASRTRRVWVDGRADELVRGIDLVGTPLVAFQSILAAGDTPEVFNGTCGAESGWVPVSAVAPPLLFSRLEFQLKEKSSQRPPLLDKPGAEDGEVVLP